MTVHTERLDLVAATTALLAAEEKGRASLASWLEAEIPATWPPELYEAPARAFAVSYLHRHPDAMGWMFWYMLLRSEATASRTAIGVIGFKGTPDDEGTVEIGYSVLAAYQRAGYATEAVGALLHWAFDVAAVQRVIAETYPALKASRRVLEKQRFVCIGAGSEEGVIRYELSRAVYEAYR